jgi:uncharacterized iron-regulated protein
MLARTHLMRIQRSMYAKLRDQARHYLGGLSPELRKYFVEYQREFQEFKSISSKQDLLAAMQCCHVAFCGDYHTLSQAQRTVIRLLRDSLQALHQRGKEPILLLEMVTPDDNPHIEAYLSGSLSERGFLKAIRFAKNWGFDWNNYRRLFDFARDEGIQILGINGPTPGGGSSLVARDRFAAKIVAQTTKANPDALVIVLVGDLHLAQSHLPGRVREELVRLKTKRRILTIHQNNERFYWKLAEKGLEQFVDVVKVREDIYCVMNTPPWIKLQSHLKWNEIITEMPKAPLARKWDSALEEIDQAEDIREAIQLIRCFFQLPDLADDNFSLVSQANEDFISHMRANKIYTNTELKILHRFVREFKSQFIARSNLICLSTLNPNHSAALAAIYIHGQLSKIDRIFQNPDRDFYPFIWIEGLAFLGSKVVNHKRKCNGISNLESLARTVNSSSKRYELNRLAALVVGHVRSEIRSKGTFRFPLPKRVSNPEQVVFYYKAAKILGALLGQALYQGLIEGEISREQIRQLFLTPFLKLGKTRNRHLYLSWLRRLDGHGYRRIDKTEKL